MVVVTNVRDFALLNAEDLRRFMMYKTGIRDVEVIKDTIQDFYVKLIDTKALDTFNPKEGTFKTYIMNLFCWLFPVLANRNPRSKYTIVSHVRTSERRHPYTDDMLDVYETVATPGRAPHAINTIDPNYFASHVREDEELESDLEIREFVEYLKRTQTPRSLSRLLPYVEHKACGCNGADVAKILGVSNNMVKIIKERARIEYETWRNLKMTGGRKARQLTRAEIVDEIRNTQDLIQRFNAGDISLPHGFSYKEAILRLKYLRNRQLQLSKKKKPKEDCD